MSSNFLTRRSFLLSSAAGGALMATGGPAVGASAPAPEPSGAINLFPQPDLNFETLFALGETAYGAGEAGEVLATVDAIKRAGVSYASFCDGFLHRARQTADIAHKCEDAGHRVSARSAHLRTAQYINQALFFVLGTDKPADEASLYRKMQQHWDRAARLFEPAFEPVKIPYEDTYLPGYFLGPGDKKRRPTVIVMNGSDAQFIDVYAFGGAAALERGWNALLFEGPGQGAMLFEREIPFRPDWEKVITPVVDYLYTRPEVDTRRIALTGWSFGGLLATRTAAFEKRLAAVVADPGSVDSWAAYPKQLRGLVEHGGGREQVDRVWQQKIIPHLPVEARFTLSKRSEIMGREYLEMARRGKVFDSLWDYAHTVQQYRIPKEIADKVDAPILVTQYEEEQFLPEGGKRLYAMLPGPKKLVTFTKAEGAGLHDGPLSPQRRNQVVFDWLEETLARYRSPG